ncbi:hypothetical protein GCM10022392_01650 [Mucilaginibacter panaciglaebae]|uniref:Uncharacterized protein n=1 Tax=Mucilaginibacter panaciglaebae TaxID=502331 RepID=A0ABP7WAU3_9SPHI
MLNNRENQAVSVHNSNVDINSDAGKTLIRIDRSIVNNNTSMFKRVEFAMLFIFTGMDLLIQKANIVTRQIALPATRQHTFLALRCIRI